MIKICLQQIDVLFSQRLDPAGQEFPVTSTIQHLATVNNSFMVVVEAITIGFRQLLNVLHTVPVTVSSCIIYHPVYGIGSTQKVAITCSNWSIFLYHKRNLLNKQSKFDRKVANFCNIISISYAATIHQITLSSCGFSSYICIYLATCLCMFLFCW